MKRHLCKTLPLMFLFISACDGTLPDVDGGPGDDQDDSSDVAEEDFPIADDMDVAGDDTDVEDADDTTVDDTSDGMADEMSDEMSDADTGVSDVDDMDVDAGGDDVVDMGPDGYGPVTTPDAPYGIPLPGCGMPEYERLPPDVVGVPLSFEQRSTYSPTEFQLKVVLNVAASDFPIEYFPIDYGVRTYEMRYTTQDKGELIEATAFVSTPRSYGTHATVLYTHGTTGFSDECAPTNMGIEGAVGNMLLSGMGAITVAPDYIGMNGFGEASDRGHPYIIGEPTAIASIDAVRAAWRYLDANPTVTNVTRTDELSFFGGSEGGFAAFWSDRLTPYYLPEAQPVAVSALVPPTDLMTIFKYGASTTSLASAGASAVVASMHDYYELQTPLTQFLKTPFSEVIPMSMETECGTPSIYDDAEYSDVFSDAVIDGLAADDFSELGVLPCMISRNSINSSIIPRQNETPLLYIFSENDDLVWSGGAVVDIPALCDGDYNNMQTIQCADASHTDGAIQSLHLGFEFIRDRLNGEPLTAECELTAPIQCDETETLPN